MTYICRDCGKIIDEDEVGTYTDRGEVWGSPYSQDYDCCPWCKGWALEELDLCCEICEELITGKYICTEDGHYYCDNCYTEGDIRFD